MTASRPPYQLTLDLSVPDDGEAVAESVQEVEAATATAGPERPASTTTLMEAICDRANVLGRILWFQSVVRIARSRQLGPATTAMRRVGPVEDVASALCRTPSSRGPQGRGPPSRGQPERPVAIELYACAEPRPLRCALQTPRSASDGESNWCVTRRTAGYGSVRPVVWEGRHREMPPYPD